MLDTEWLAPVCHGKKTTANQWLSLCHCDELTWKNTKQAYSSGNIQHLIIFLYPLPPTHTQTIFFLQVFLEHLASNKHLTFSIKSLLLCHCYRLVSSKKTSQFWKRFQGFVEYSVNKEVTFLIHSVPTYVTFEHFLLPVSLSTSFFVVSVSLVSEQQLILEGGHCASCRGELCADCPSFLLC